MSQAGLLSEDLLAEPEPILVPLVGWRCLQLECVSRVSFLAAVKTDQKGNCQDEDGDGEWFGFHDAIDR